jgi:hypothetical protein
MSKFESVSVAGPLNDSKRVGIIRSNRGAKTAWVREAIGQLPEEFGVGELVHSCSGVSRPMIRVVLEALRKEGKLEVLGTGRGAKWRKRDNIR